MQFQSESEKASETMFTRFCDFLASQNIDYCLVGDTQSFPDVIQGDVDLVVEPQVWKQMGAHLLKFCDQQKKVKLVQEIQHEQSAKFFVLAWRNNEGTLQYLKPDVYFDYFYEGKKLLGYREFLDGKLTAFDPGGSDKGFFIPKPTIEFVYYLLKKINKGTIEQRHAKYLSDVWKKDPIGCAIQIKRFWADEDAAVLVHASESCDWSEVQTLMHKLKRNLTNEIPLSVVYRLLEMRRVVHRVLAPSGFFIAVLGADGSGKSSNISAIIRDLGPAFRRTHYVHLRPRVGLGEQVNGIAVTDPHSQEPRGWLLSVIKVIYFLLDYSLGYLRIVRPLMIRSTLIVFDRYYYDILVDPKRYRYSGSTRLARLVAKMVPKPNLIILFDAPAAVLQQRKPEVSFDESIRQRKQYLKLVGDFQNSIVIDASKSIDEVMVEVTDSIVQVLANKVKEKVGG